MQVAARSAFPTAVVFASEQVLAERDRHGQVEALAVRIQQLSGQ